MIVKASVALMLLTLVVSPLSAKNDKHESKGNKHQKHEKKQKSLNKGMQKKVDRGGELPKGWQKKLVVGEKLDQEVYRQSRTLKTENKKGEITVRIDNKVIRLYKATMEIVDILELH